MAKNRKHQKRRNITLEGFIPTQNPAQAEAMRELASSNAAQKHVSAPRKGTRREREQQAIRDQHREERG